MQPLAGVAELRAHTGAEWPDEALALRVLRAASSTVRDYCGWVISREENTEADVDSDGGRLLALPTLHLTGVYEITDADTSEPITGYRWSRTGLIHRREGWPSGLGRVRVRYDSGHDVTPESVVAVVCSLAGRAGVPQGVASMTVGAQTVTYAPDSAGPGLSRVEQAVLDRYQIK